MRMSGWLGPLALAAGCSSSDWRPAPEPALTLTMPRASAAEPRDAEPVASGDLLAGAFDGLAQARLAQHQICSRVSCASELPPGNLRFGEAPAALWTVDVDGRTLELPQDGGLDLFGLALGGACTISDPRDPAHFEHLLAPGGAFHAPGGDVRLGSATRCRLVLAIASDGLPLHRRARDLRPAVARLGRIELTHMERTTPLVWAGGKVSAWLLFERGRASFGLLASAPGAGAPEHRHEGAWEIVAVLRGEGTSLLESPSGRRLEPREVASGDVLAIPAGAAHAFRAAGSVPLVAVQLYLPPGPEQRFKDLAAAEAR